jgi:TrmH family RNA methyltransferase
MNIRIVLLNPQEEGNIGATARAMRNFGFDELYIVDPLCVLGGVARAFASHGINVLENARIVKTYREAIQGCDIVVGTTGKKGGHKTAKRKAITPQQLRENLCNGKTALVFGNEASGIPNKIIEKTDFVVRIPTSPDYPILNLAQSVVILLYELAKKDFEKTVKAKPISRKMRAQLDRFTNEIVDKVYEQDHQKKFMTDTLNRIYGKSMLSEQEGRRIISFYRKIMVQIKFK